MVQAQVPVPSGWMDASLTRRIHILLSRAALNVLVWACGQISYQSGWAHTKGGVTKCVASGIGTDCGGVTNITFVAGRAGESCREREWVLPAPSWSGSKWD